MKGTKRNPIVVDDVKFFMSEGFWFCEKGGIKNMVFKKEMVEMLNVFRKKYGKMNVEMLNFMRYSEKGI